MSHSPDQVWRALRSDPVANKLSDSQIWDLVARIWWKNMKSADLVEGEALYRRDCAACHGEKGKGDGIFSSERYGDYDSPHDSELDNHLSDSPVDFQDKDHMLSASPALLQGKILRGGMGTGMPSWGFIFTENQTWSLVSYLWTFLFSE